MRPPPDKAARARIRAAAQAHEERRAIIRHAMSLLGSASTPAKRRAVRANGRLGGRPKKGPPAS